MTDINIKNKPDLKQVKIIRDIMFIIAITVLTFVLAFIFDLSERYYEWSRLWEQYQADELIFPLLSFSIGLIWFSWRRYREAKAESIANISLLSENRLLIHNMTENQQHERLFICQELHDVFAQDLTALRTYAELIQTIAPTENSQLSSTTQKIINHVDKLHGVTRSLLKTLRPPLLEFGVVMAVEDLVTQWQHTHKDIQCQLEFHGMEPDLNEQQLLTLYRTIQEGLSNIARHTKASHVDIELYFPTDQQHSPAMLTLHLINDGVEHFQTEPIKTGLGLIGIRERASILNGHFNIGPYPPSGVKLELSFPIQKQSIA
ncbi:MAG: hypothetical protein COA83_02590 [Methylophaga sp.]|nr:MAG: hypothetical protein COA83_02590 [Methylophaga sp.]